MKNILVVVFALLCPLLRADNDSSGNPVPADLQWESLSQGMQLGWELEFLSTSQKYRMAVYLKNTSGSPKYFAKFGRDKGFRFFYTDSQGIQHDLHTPPRDRVENAVHLSFIKPGEIETQRIELDSADLPILKANQIQCSVQLGEATTDVHSTLTSSPRQFSVPQ